MFENRSAASWLVILVIGKCTEIFLTKTGSIIPFSNHQIAKSPWGDFWGKHGRLPLLKAPIFEYCIAKDAKHFWTPRFHIKSKKPAPCHKKFLGMHYPPVLVLAKCGSRPQPLPAPILGTDFVDWPAPSMGRVGAHPPAPHYFFGTCQEKGGWGGPRSINYPPLPTNFHVRSRHRMDLLYKKGVGKGGHEAMFKQAHLSNPH